MFAPGFGTIRCIHIAILSDECLEDETESFNVSLSSDQNCVTFDVSEIPVYIVDDDCKLSVTVCYWLCSIVCFCSCFSRLY